MFELEVVVRRVQGELGPSDQICAPESPRTGPSSLDAMRNWGAADVWMRSANFGGRRASADTGLECGWLEVFRAADREFTMAQTTRAEIRMFNVWQKEVLATCESLEWCSRRTRPSLLLWNRNCLKRMMMVRIDW